MVEVDAHRAGSAVDADVALARLVELSASVFSAAPIGLLASLPSLVTAAVRCGEELLGRPAGAAQVVANRARTRVSAP